MRLYTINQYKNWRLLEASIQIDTVLDQPEIILVRSLSKSEIKLCLYNTINQDILGYITANRSSGNIWQIDRTAAEKGYGPLMYDILLQELNPNGLKPSNKIKPQALNVWNYYYSNRSDVTKYQLKSDNPSYSEYFTNSDAEDEIQKTDEQTLKVINTVFFKKQTPEFIEFITNSENVLKEKGISKSTILKNALSYFELKYYGANASYVYEELSNKEEMYFLGNGSEYCLTTKSKILAYANVIKKDDYYIFDKIYGPGYGYLMHTYVLMSLYPLPVRPSASSKPQVINIWKRIKEIAETKEATDKWLSYDDSIISTQTADLDVVNTLYKVHPNSDFYKLVANSKQFENKMQTLLPGYVQKRLKLGREMYTDSYIEN